jgi:2-polyprenyl-3-methyl-5-hydroxy-6-metoxy-1,4-benzoquinol methylase
MITLEELAKRVASQYPMIGKGLFPLVAAVDDPRRPYAEMALEHAMSMVRDEGDLDRLVEAFAVTSIDFIRLQARFYETGHYARSGASNLVEDLYGDDEKMSGYYLDGLALTYSLWSNHADLLRHYVTEFVDRLDPGTRLVEVGPGHGLMASLFLARCAGSTYDGLDISESALRHAGAALDAAGVAADRYALHLGDIMQSDLAEVFDVPVEAAVCCEVLEHVDTPGAITDGLHSILAPGGLAFVSTVANLEAEDHVYLFDDAGQIRDLIEASGFTVEHEQVRALPGAEDRVPLPLNYSAVLRRPT